MRDDDQDQGDAGWQTGTAVCALCHVRWVAVAPVDRAPVGLECPGCGHMSGDFDSFGIDVEGE